MITVNGVTIESKGHNNIQCVNGRVIVDGVDITPNTKIINIRVTGDVRNIEGSFSDIIITGNVTGEVNTGSGDIEISGDVGGSVKTGSGDVDIKGEVKGNVRTGSGDITHKT